MSTMGSYEDQHCHALGIESASVMTSTQILIRHWIILCKNLTSNLLLPHMLNCIIVCFDGKIELFTPLNALVPLDRCLPCPASGGKQIINLLQRKACCLRHQEKYQGKNNDSKTKVEVPDIHAYIAVAHIKHV